MPLDETTRNIRSPSNKNGNKIEMTNISMNQADSNNISEMKTISSDSKVKLVPLDEKQGLDNL